MSRVLSWFVVALASSTVVVAPSVVVSQPALAQGLSCWPIQLPLGALAPNKPIWCSDLATGPSTFNQGPNSWLDDFEHGLSNASMGEGYQIFDAQGASIRRSQFFRHNDHWMVDINGYDENGPDGPFYNMGGAMMRPDRSFHFENGMLVVEADVAAGITDYRGNAWPEIEVTTAAAPTHQPSRDGTYAYDFFAHDWTVGCRLESKRTPVCALWDNSGRGSGAGGRLFEINSVAREGAQVKFGGYPSGDRDDAWRVCEGTDPDLNCRDRFRWELTRDRLTLYVNGIKYMEHAGLPPDHQLPEALVSGDVYVYFNSWISAPDAATVRFHWARVAVNPTTGPSAAPGYAATVGSQQ